MSVQLGRGPLNLHRQQTEILIVNSIAGGPIADLGVARLLGWELQVVDNVDLVYTSHSILLLVYILHLLLPLQQTLTDAPFLMLWRLVDWRTEQRHAVLVVAIVAVWNLLRLHRIYCA